MKQTSLSGGGVVLLAVALAGAPAIHALAQTAATTAATTAAPEAPPAAAPVATTTAEPTKPEPAAAAPTQTAAMPMPAKPAAAVPAPAPIKGSATTEQHIARLHQALKITPAQQPQWDAFAEVMRENAAHMEAIAKAHPESAPKLNAIDGLKAYEDVTQAHLEDLQKLEPAFASLYGTMSDSQKKTADGMFSRRAEVKKVKAVKAAPAAGDEQQ